MADKSMDRLRSRGGFTLAETLLAVLILLLVSAIVAAGIPVAQRAYERVVLGANAQVLLSTTAAALRDELGTAWDVEASGTSVAYFSADTGARSRVALDDAGKRIMLREYTVVDGLVETLGTERPLVSAAAATRDLYATYEGVSYEDGIVTFSGLKVCRSANDATLVELGQGSDHALRIRVFSAKTDATGD